MTAVAPPLPSAFRLLHYDTIGSTNDELKQLARDGAAGGTICWAEAQTAGRGRRGREWVSPPGNLYASLLWRPDCAPARAAQLGFVAALALAEALEPLLPPARQLRCKWPNDLLLDGRKLAGILLESETAGMAAEFVVIGVGVNLATSPPNVEFAATSLAGEGISGVAPGTVLAGFAAGFERWERVWRIEGFGPIRLAWRERASGIGEAIRVRLDGATLQGKFVDLDETGALLLEEGLRHRRIAAGDIFPASAG